MVLNHSKVISASKTALEVKSRQLKMRRIDIARLL